MTFQHKLVIKGSPEDLDEIHQRLSFRQDKGRLAKCSELADLQLPPQVLAALGDRLPVLGTTRLELEFDGHREPLRASILQRFPKVAVS